MAELHPDRTKMFEITCDWKGEPKTALIVVYFGKNGKVSAYAPVDRGFYLTHKARPLNWAVWDLRLLLQETYHKGGPIPSDKDFWSSVAKAARASGADEKILHTIIPWEPIEGP